MQIPIPVIPATALLSLTLGLAPAAFGQGIPKIETVFNDGSRFEFYGQINKGFLNYDDGEENKTYDLIDNANSNTRFGFNYGRQIGANWDFSSKFEMAYDPYSSGKANIERDVPDGAYDFTLDNYLRYADFVFSSDRVGTFWLGQGSMASDGSAEADLSRTGVIAYSSVGDSAGGQLFRLTDGELSDITVGGAFTNLDGLSRKMRVRYDTPEFSGFTGKISYGQDVLNDNSDDLYDVAVNYGNTHGDFEVTGAAAYAWKGADVTILSGSGSILHTPTGINFTLAGGNQDNNGVNGSYGYAKLGWIGTFWNIGYSAFAVDWYKGDSLNTEAAHADTWSASYVQKIDRANTEFYLTARQFSYDDDAGDYDDGQAYFTGLRFKW